MNKLNRTLSKFIFLALVIQIACLPQGIAGPRKFTDEDLEAKRGIINTIPYIFPIPQASIGMLRDTITGCGEPFRRHWSDRLRISNNFEGYIPQVDGLIKRLEGSTSPQNQDACKNTKREIGKILGILNRDSQQRAEANLKSFVENFDPAEDYRNYLGIKNGKDPFNCTALVPTSANHTRNKTLEEFKHQEQKMLGEFDKLKEKMKLICRN